MSCNNCKGKKICSQKTCGCPIPDLSAKCVVYDGEKLHCIGADTPDNLNSLIKKFDKAICQKLDFILEKGNLINVGGGVELYQGINQQGQKEIRTLVSSDGSVTIELDDDTVDIKVEGVTLFTLENESTTSDANILSEFDEQENKYTFKGLKSNSITIDEDAEGNITLEVTIPEPGQNTTVSSNNNSITVVEDNGNYDLAVNFPQPDLYIVGIASADNTVSVVDVNSDTTQWDLSVNFPVPDLEQADPQESDFVKGQNLQKVIDNNYVVQASDNNYTILVEASKAIVIDVDPNLPNNFFVGFIQDGAGEVSFDSLYINKKPTGKEFLIEGDGHNAAIEKINDKVFLLGSLKDEE